jgi:hypothetical protein
LRWIFAASNRVIKFAFLFLKKLGFPEQELVLVEADLATFNSVPPSFIDRLIPINRKVCGLNVLAFECLEQHFGLELVGRDKAESVARTGREAKKRSSQS